MTQSMFPILTTTDLGRSLAFYRDLLGGVVGYQFPPDGDADFVSLDLTSASFNLSDRGVEGAPHPGPLDAFAWTDRGIYRPGETVQLMALLRDAAGQPADLLLFDPHAPWRIDADTLPGIWGNTPFDGLPVEGKVLRVWKGGREVSA